MRIRKTNKPSVMIALVLSVFLLAGCGADTTGEAQTEPGVAEEEISNDKDLGKENDIKEEDQDKDTANDNTVTDEQKAAPGKIDIYDYVLAEYTDMVQNDFYIGLLGSDAYDSSFGENIGLEIRTHKQYLLRIL